MYGNIAAQLGYSRRFHGLGSVQVHIPGSLHLESFDQKEYTVKLHSLLLLFDSALTFAFEHHNESDELTFIEMDKLSKEYLFFVGYVNMNINQLFYKYSITKSNFTCTINLTHIGKSSYTFRFELESPSQTIPLATMELVTVCVSMKTRRPTSFPLWWKEKYGPSVSSRYTPVLLKPLNKPAHCVRLPMRIMFSDTDIQGHTNWATYIRICYETFMESCVRKAYSNICEEDARNGIQFFEMSFMKESVLGDTLESFSWEMVPKKEKLELGFEIKNGDVKCCQARMLLHESDKYTTTQTKSKL